MTRMARMAVAILALAAGHGEAGAQDTSAAPTGERMVPRPVPALALPPRRAEAAASPISDLIQAETTSLADIAADPWPSLGAETAGAAARAGERYLDIVANGGWPKVPAGVKLAPGIKDAAVGVLRERLAASGDLPRAVLDGTLYDDEVEAAVKHFQLRHGLARTGSVGPQTLAALNVAAVVRLNQLTASARRLAGLSVGFGERYVVVNIPAATVELVKDGRLRQRLAAVVGRPDRPSPTLETRITTVNFNPTWTVPASIVKKDIIPRMRDDPGYLAKNNIRILDPRGNEVSPATLDWSTEQAANFMLREDPGKENSLGAVRIDMPNRDAVYMHDTPLKRLFGSSFRFHSSGCVRVSRVEDFAAWLLEGNRVDGTTPWDRTAIDAAIAIGSRIDVKLAKPVPVVWTYLTGYATPDGLVHFRDDVYRLDSGTETTASLAPPLPPPPRPFPATAPGEPRKPASGSAEPVGAAARPR